MKTQTIFSDPMIARSIATAIHQRTVRSSRPAAPKLVLDWIRHALRKGKLKIS